MKLRTSLTVVALTWPLAAAAQAPSRAVLDSVRTVVQRFYTWYVPRAADPHGRDMVMYAATHGPLRFDSDLVKWLRIDSVAQARAKGEIDGLDFDPYVNGQDSCEAYSVIGVRPEGTDLLVDVRGHGGCPKHQSKDVTVILQRRAGAWFVIDFLDPDYHNQKLSHTLRILHPQPK